MNAEQVGRLLQSAINFDCVFSIDNLPHKPRLLVCKLDPCVIIGHITFVIHRVFWALFVYITAYISVCSEEQAYVWTTLLLVSPRTLLLTTTVFMRLYVVTYWNKRQDVNNCICCVFLIYKQTVMHTQYISVNSQLSHCSSVVVAAVNSKHCSRMGCILHNTCTGVGPSDHRHCSMVSSELVSGFLLRWLEEDPVDIPFI